MAGHFDTHRLLERRGRPAPPITVGRRTLLLRRVAAGVALVAAAALVVLALGLLADGVAAARLPGPVASPARTAGPAGAGAGGERVLTVDAPGTVWDLASRVEPGATAAQRAALVGRIVSANALTEGEVHPGQVLRVPAG